MENKEVDKPRKRLSVNNKEFVPKSVEAKIKRLEADRTGLGALVEVVDSLNNNYKFENEFPRLQSYGNLEKLRATFPSLATVNGLHIDLQAYEQSSFFLICSETLDDLHKALKYGLWTSTPEVNRELSRHYQDAIRNGTSLVLLFKSPNDNTLSGAAELISDYIADQQFDLWWSRLRLKGVFLIRWLFAKNIDLSYINQSVAGQKIYELQDGTQLTSDTGLVLLGLFQHFDFSLSNSIFNFFPLLDQREDALIKSRSSVDFQFKLQKKESRRPSGIESSEAVGSKRASIHNSGKRNSAYLQHLAHTPTAPRREAHEVGAKASPITASPIGKEAIPENQFTSPLQSGQQDGPDQLKSVKTSKGGKGKRSGKDVPLVQYVKKDSSEDSQPF